MKICFKKSAALIAILLGTASSFAAEKAAAKGFYLGLSAGGAATIGQYNGASVGSRTANYTFLSAANYGAFGGLFGAALGYNFQTSAFVIGLDMNVAFDTTKKDVFNTIPSGNTARAYTSKFNIKKSMDFNVGPRIGFMVNDNSMLYAKIGFNYGKWQYTITPDIEQINSTLNTVTDATLRASTSKVLTNNKNSFDFAPGVGVELYKNKVLFRVEYTYISGPTIKATQDMSGLDNACFEGTGMTHSMKLSQHQMKAVIGYKF